MYDLSTYYIQFTKNTKMQNNKIILYQASLLLVIIVQSFTIQGFNIPKFYHGRIFLDEPRFSQDGLTSADITVAGGTKRFCRKGYEGRLDFTELIFQAYQNFDKGFFLHGYVPFCWIKLNDIELVDKDNSPLPHCIRKTDMYSPGVFVGWTLNHEETKHLDFIDFTLEAGALLNSPKDSQTPVLFPVGYTHKPGFAAASYCALGALEWITTGVYAQAIFFNPATIWSTGYYFKCDHLIPTLSLTFALCGDGQHKQIECIEPWQMLSTYLSLEVDLATDNRPWLPRIKGIFSKPIAGHNILKAGLGGFSIGFDVHIIF